MPLHLLAGGLIVRAFGSFFSMLIYILTKPDLKYDNCNVPSEWNDSGVSSHAVKLIFLKVLC